MNIKPIVNNPELWKAFQEYLDETMLKVAHKKLKQESDMATIYRLQGDIRTIERIMKLRDAVNGVTD